MKNIDQLEGKKVLVVDDEPDILETLEDLLPQCDVVTARDFDEAKQKLESERFDLVILDIMGVDGYRLLDIAAAEKIITVMLTARATTPDDVLKSYRKGAAYYIPKEEMADISNLLNDILTAIEKGEDTWQGWVKRMANFCQRKFGPDWEKNQTINWEKFPFY